MEQIYNKETPLDLRNFSKNPCSIPFNLYIFHLGFYAFGSKWAESALKSDFFEKT